jgi:hypothetical protein
VGEKKNAPKVLVGIVEGRIKLGRITRTFDHNIIMDFKEIRWDFVKWVFLARERH